MADDRENRPDETKSQKIGYTSEKPIGLDDFSMAASGEEEEEEIIDLTDYADEEIIDLTDNVDEEIIDLTEEVIDTAMGAVPNAAGPGGEAEEMDLEETDVPLEEYLANTSLAGPDTLFPEAQRSRPGEAYSDQKDDDIEADINHTLDDFFASEEKESEIPELNFESDPAAAFFANPGLLDAAVERAISRLYGEKIEKIVEQMIEDRLHEILERLKKEKKEE